MDFHVTVLSPFLLPSEENRFFPSSRLSHDKKKTILIYEQLLWRNCSLLLQIHMVFSKWVFHAKKRMKGMFVTQGQNIFNFRDLPKNYLLLLNLAKYVEEPVFVFQLFFILSFYSDTVLPLIKYYSLNTDALRNLLEIQLHCTELLHLFYTAAFKL